jgi:hypothetical protein
LNQSLNAQISSSAPQNQQLTCYLSSHQVGAGQYLDVQGTNTLSVTNPLGELVCCLDESGTNDQSPIITTGGYVATAAAWAGFERRAGDVFCAYGLQYLHGVEFQNRKPPYNTWSPIKQRTFLIELFDIVRDTVEFGVTFSVRKSAYGQAKKDHGLAINESGYGFAFRSAVDLILRDEIVQEAIAKLGVKLSFVVESGCPNEGDVRRIFNQHKQHTDLAGIMGTLKVANKKAAIALQVSDFLAHQTRRYVDVCEAHGGAYQPMPDALSIMTNKIVYRDAVATGFYPTRPTIAA